jgi:hypothetical protein
MYSNSFKNMSATQAVVPLTGTPAFGAQIELMISRRNSDLPEDTAINHHIAPNGHAPPF